MKEIGNIIACVGIALMTQALIKQILEKTPKFRSVGKWVTFRLVDWLAIAGKRFNTTPISCLSSLTNDCPRDSYIKGVVDKIFGWTDIAES